MNHLYSGMNYLTRKTEGNNMKRIKAMAGLRNTLIHEYLKVDIPRLYDYLKNRLGDFTEFMSYTQKYLAQKS